MGRWHVHVVHMRARDVRVGDVVARDPTKFDGWFRVHEIRQLANGNFNVLDKSNALSFTAGPFDLVGLQTPVQLPIEAESNARGAESGHRGAGTARSPEARPAAAPASQDDSAAAAARREAAAREAMARGETSGGARALPGA